jgi:hypothetical protein
LKTEFQALKEEARKCCNFEVHVQKNYTTTEKKNVVSSNGQKKKNEEN